MRVRLDTELCQGHGRCYTLAPELFDSDDLGHCVLLVDEVPVGHESAGKPSFICAAFTAARVESPSLPSISPV